MKKPAKLRIFLDICKLKCFFPQKSERSKWLKVQIRQASLPFLSR